MAVTVSVEKQDESCEWCVYAFGGPDAKVGRLTLDKMSGDIEIDELSEAPGSANKEYYLAHVVPRLQSYHEEHVYPDSDKWQV